MGRVLLIIVDQGRFTVPVRAVAGEHLGLCRTAGYADVSLAVVRLREPAAGHFLGSGRVSETAARIVSEKADRVVISVDLSAVQQRNLQAAWGVPVTDRTTLILDIFARHARSAEGKVQVELARASRDYSRLTGRGASLSRLGGGVGTRGPGEMKLEEDRRRIRARIASLERRIESLGKQRRQARERQRRLGFSQAVLVGYTNAGKSSLLNALCGRREAAAADRLFSTLDPTTRRVYLGKGAYVLATDTVGFLRDLPHELIAAFHATLEGLASAGLLLVVLDGASPFVFEQYDGVRRVLEKVSAHRVPAVPVLNKIDLVDEAGRARLARKIPGLAMVSCRTGEGVATLRGLLREKMPAPAGGAEDVRISRGG